MRFNLVLFFKFYIRYRRNSNALQVLELGKIKYRRLESCDPSAFLFNTQTRGELRPLLRSQTMMNIKFRYSNLALSYSKHIYIKYAIICNM